MEHCGECGYRYDALDRDRLADEIRAFGPRYASLLDTAPDALRAHPIAGSWSALEYGCHLRDVLRTQRERVTLAIEEDTPTFASMRREERVAEEHYNEQSPHVVAQELIDAAASLAAAFDALDGEGWHRMGVYAWPTTQIRTLEWVARHTVHEGVHHVMDVERLLEAASRR